MGCQLVNKKKHFIIKWKGYPSEQNTIEPPEHLTNVQYMVDEYKLAHPTNKARKTDPQQ